VNPKDGLTYVWIPPGKFEMGCSPGDSECTRNEKPPHEVAITHGFWLGQTPVIEAAYERFLEANGKRAILCACDDMPVVLVTWEDARKYCDAGGPAGHGPGEQPHPAGVARNAILWSKLIWCHFGNQHPGKSRGPGHTR
jgi:formylglycine-generating enzyme required for sulfatase activity